MTFNRTLMRQSKRPSIRSPQTHVMLLGMVCMLAACASSSGVPVHTPTSPKDMAFAFPAQIKICGGMRVSNQPQSRYSRFAQISPNVALARAPIERGCLSSGFGPRFGRMHKGVDYHHNEAVDIYAGGNGRVIEVTTHDDFGKYILIYHGDGVYTRYAHLEWIPPRIYEGALVTLGAPIASMGNTGRTNARHLHYEVLVGNYNTPKRSFGLKAIDILSAPIAS